MHSACGYNNCCMVLFFVDPNKHVSSNKSLNGSNLGDPLSPGCPLRRLLGRLTPQISHQGWPHGFSDKGTDDLNLPNTYEHFPDLHWCWFPLKIPAKHKKFIHFTHGSNYAAALEFFQGVFAGTKGPFILCLGLPLKSHLSW